MLEGTVDVALSHPSLAMARAQEICDARLKEAENVRLLRKVKADRVGLRERLALGIGNALVSLGLRLVVKGVSTAWSCTGEPETCRSGSSDPDQTLSCAVTGFPRSRNR